MIQSASGLRIRGVESRAEGMEEVGFGRSCVEKTAEASKSAAFVDEKGAGMYLRAGIQGGSSSIRLFSRRAISVKIQITGLARAGSAAGRIPSKPPSRSTNGFPGGGLAMSHMITVLTSGKPCPGKAIRRGEAGTSWASNLHTLSVSG